MPLIPFDAVHCFNELGDWIYELRALRPPTFEQFVEAAFCRDEFGSLDERKEWTPDKWEAARQEFEQQYADDPCKVNLTYCNALENRRNKFIHNHGWSLAHAQSERVAHLLNHGAVHSFETSPDYAWRDLLPLWQRFQAIRQEAGLTSPQSPWHESGQCVLPVVPDAELHGIEGEILRVAECFELFRWAEGLSFVDSQNIADSPPHRPLTLPNEYGYANGHAKWSHDESGCDFKSTPFPLDVLRSNLSRRNLSRRIDAEHTSYVRCQQCGEEYSLYRCLKSSVGCECRPNTMAGVVWRARQANPLLFHLWCFRRAWCCLDRLREWSDWRTSNTERAELIKLTESHLGTYRQRIEVEAETNATAAALIPMMQSPLPTTALTRKLNPKIVSHINSESCDYGRWSLWLDDTERPQLFCEEAYLLEAEIPSSELNAIPFRDDRWCDEPNDPRAKKRRGDVKKHANEVAAQMISENLDVSAAQIAARAGCAKGTVSDLPAWRDLQEYRNMGRAPKALSLTSKFESSLGEDDLELRHLIDESERDARSEPSPTEEDPPGRKRRVYAPKQV